MATHSTESGCHWWHSRNLSTVLTHSTLHINRKYSLIRLTILSFVMLLQERNRLPPSKVVVQYPQNWLLSTPTKLRIFFLFCLYTIFYFLIWGKCTINIRLSAVVGFWGQGSTGSWFLLKNWFYMIIYDLIFADFLLSKNAKIWHLKSICNVNDIFIWKYRGSPTYAKITNAVPYCRVFGLCTHKWGIFALVRDPLQL